MEFKSFSILSSLAVFLVFVVVAQSAPNNSTTPAATPKPVTASINGTTVSNSTTSGNKTASGEEDCEAEPEPVAGAGERQGKQLSPGEKEKYKHDGTGEPEAISEPISKTNATANAAQPGGDAAKLQGNSSTTTVAPATGGAITAASTLWANVIFATLLSSFASISSL